MLGLGISIILLCVSNLLLCVYCFRLGKEVMILKDEVF